MKNRFTKILAVLSCTFILVGLLPFMQANNVKAEVNTEVQGATFDTSADYLFNKPIESIPRTFEAWIKVPTDTPDGQQAIFGNYKALGYSSVYLELYGKGVPHLKWTEGAEDHKSNVASGSALFNGCDVRTGEWVHLAITWTDTHATLYTNGVKYQHVRELARPREDLQFDQYFGIGTDNKHTAKPFLGEIKEVACFSDVRTEEEILADMQGLDLTDENIMFAFQPRPNQDVFYDITGHGYRAGVEWIDEKDIEIPENYDYSFMVVGDPQYLTQKHPDKLPKIYDYILANAQGKKVKHVIGVGDITNGDNAYEWDVAKAQITRMDGVVPYSLVRGNHDVMSSGRDNSKASRFDEYFGPNSTYANQYTYCYEGDNPEFGSRNTIHLFSSTNYDYMVVALDFGANDDVLKWASDIIEAHPGHNVIVTTHGYLEMDGKPIPDDSSSSPTNWGMTDSVGINTASALWDKFISQHENIVMVFSGHVLSDRIVLNQRKGVNGNVVSEVLVNAQDKDNTTDPVGMVATFYVSADGSTITAEWYSTIKEKYYKVVNNFTFNVNVVDRVPQKTITFDANGGSGEMTAIDTYRETYTLPTCTFTAPTYYAFKGWALSPNGQIIDGTSIDLTEDITLYAIWEKAVYTINFNANGGSGEMQVGTCDQQSPTFTIPTCTFTAPTHYTFKGWSLSPNGQIIDSTSIDLTEDIILYAIWQRNTYTITFNGNGGVGSMADQTCNLVNYTLPTCTFTAPTHYHFKGWATSSNGEVISSTAIENVGNTTLYAIWERNVYTISYNANGGTGTMASVYCSQDNFTLPLYTFTAPANHYFKGWSTSADGEIIVGSEVAIENNTTFYAIWERVVYIITFNANGGTGTMYNGACNTDNFALPNCFFTAPTYFAFKGWALTQDGNVIEGDTITITQDITLYAIYERLNFTITATAGENGTISPSGEVVLEGGASYTYTFTANEGYKIKEVKVNGIVVDVQDSYTFTDLAQNSTITVEFEQIVVETPNETPDNTTNDNAEQKGGCGTVAYNHNDFTGGAMLMLLVAGAYLFIKSRVKN